MQKKCENCGATLQDSMKFCYNCGKRVFADTTKNVSKETYGEVLGSERYSHYLYVGGYFLVPKNNAYYAYNPAFTRESYHAGMFYYIYKGYLCKSRMDGTNIEVLTETKAEKIYVNSNGIYLWSHDKEGVRIELWDLCIYGGKKIELKIKEEISSYYIADTKIFIVTTDKEKRNYTAKWLDTNEKQWHIIYDTRENELGYNGSKSGEIIDCIMANKKRVVLWVDIAWYSYDFETEKLICIDKKEELLHDIKIKKYGETIGLNENVEIAAFDMEKDIMWIKTPVNEDGDELWEAWKIGDFGTTEKETAYSKWKVKNEIAMYSCNTDFYFDGQHMYAADLGGSPIRAYDREGHKSEAYKFRHVGRFSCGGGFRVRGKYLFFNCRDWLDGFAGGDEYQFLMTNTPTMPIRLNWMEESSRDWEKRTIAHREVIEDYKKWRKSRKIQLFAEETEMDATDPEKTISTKLEYWQEFTTYAFESASSTQFRQVGFSKSEPADRNWYALRLGSAKVHIELSINTQKDIIKAALLITDASLFEQLYQKIGNQPEITANREAKIKMLSTTREGGLNKNRAAQFEWFMGKACEFKKIVNEVL